MGVFTAPVHWREVSRIRLLQGVKGGFMFKTSPTPNTYQEGAKEKLEVCEIDIVGLGVRTLTAFPKGAVLDHFTGEISSRIKQHSLQVADGKHISNTRYIGYLTHGCAPNTALDMQNFQLVALRDIEAGEVLTIDYAATEDRLYIQFACVCGAPNCRRWIIGRKDSINAAGVDYLATQTAGKARA